MTQNIRELSRNPPQPKVSNVVGTLASPPPMPKHMTVVYFPFLHQSCSIVSELPSSKNCTTQGPVHWFATLINLLVPHDTSPHRKSFENILLYRNNENISKTPQTWAWHSVRKHPPAWTATTCANRPTGLHSKSVYRFPHGADLQWKVPPDRHQCCDYSHSTIQTFLLIWC